MSPKHGHKLLAKRSLMVVLRLVADVPHRGLDRGDTNAERAVSFLPFKRVQFWKCVMNPFEELPLRSCKALDTESVFGNEISM
jgi:hypothetical protein